MRMEDTMFTYVSPLQGPHHARAALFNLAAIRHMWQKKLFYLGEDLS